MRTSTIFNIAVILCIIPKFLNAQTPNEYFNRGNAKAKKGDFRGAIIDYTKAIELNPSNVDAFFNRGNAKAKNGDFRGAIIDYTKAIELDPSNAEACPCWCSSPTGLIIYSSFLLTTKNQFSLKGK